MYGSYHRMPNIYVTDTIIMFVLTDYEIFIVNH